MATYAPLNPVPTAWTSYPAAAEPVVWQVRSGTILLTTGTTLSDDAGTILVAPQALTISKDLPVAIRALTPTTHVTRNAI